MACTRPRCKSGNAVILGRGSINAADNAWIPYPVVTSPGLPQDRLQAFRLARPAINDLVGFEQPALVRFPLLVGAVAEVSATHAANAAGFDNKWHLRLARSLRSPCGGRPPSSAVIGADPAVACNRGFGWTRTAALLLHRRLAAYEGSASWSTEPSGAGCRRCAAARFCGAKMPASQRQTTKNTGVKINPKAVTPIMPANTVVPRA